MTETDDTKCYHAPRFSLKSLLIFVLVVCLVVGWWADRARLQRELERSTEVARFGKSQLFEHLLGSKAVGKPVARFPEVQRFADLTFDETHVSLLWEKAAKDSGGKNCIGYYFQTADIEEGHRGFYVLTIDGRIALVEAQVLLW